MEPASAFGVAGAAIDIVTMLSRMVKSVYDLSFCKRTHGEFSVASLQPSQKHHRSLCTSRTHSEQQAFMNVNDNQTVLKTPEEAAPSLIADDYESSRLQRYSVTSGHDSAWSKEFDFNGPLASSRVYRLALRSNMREIAETKTSLATPTDALFKGDARAGLNNQQLTFYNNIDEVEAESESLTTVTPRQGEHECSQSASQTIGQSGTKGNDRSWRDWVTPPADPIPLNVTGDGTSAAIKTKDNIRMPVTNLTEAVSRLFTPKRGKIELEAKTMSSFDPSHTKVLLLGIRNVGKTTILKSMNYHLNHGIHQM